MIIFLLAGIIEITLKNLHNKRLNVSHAFWILYHFLFFVYKSIHEIYEKHVKEFRIFSFD